MMISEITDPNIHFRDSLQRAVEQAQIAYNDARNNNDQEAAWHALQEFRKATEALRQFDAQNTPQNEPPMEEPSDSYRGQHQAPTHDSGSPLWDVTLNDTYPHDFYTGHAHEYEHDRHIVGIVLSYYRRPNFRLKIYRAVPLDAPRGINVGDWVAITRRYAIDHGHHALNGKFKLLTKTVAARDIFTAGDSLHEWGYDPQPFVSRRRPGTTPT